MDPLLEVENLRVRFRIKSAAKAFIEKDDDPYIDGVMGVSFSIMPGRTYGLVGESGSGKTTLARAVMGLVPVRSGVIRFNGHHLAALSRKRMKPFRREIALMFQDPAGSLSPRLKIRSILAEPFRIHGLMPHNLSDEIARLLKMVNLSPSMGDLYPHQLSGGQARRVGVARALALSPRLIIADEPTAGLDVSVQGEILNLMARLQIDTGVSFLIITHNLAVVRHVSDHVAIMYLGRFLEQGPTRTVFNQMRHPYTQALLSAHASPDPDAVHHRISISGEIPGLVSRPTGCEFHTRCPRVRQRCRREFPDMSGADSDHRFYCHYPLSVPEN